MSEAEDLRDLPPQGSTSDGDTRISDAIGKLLKNPELIGMIGSMMASAPKSEKSEEQKPAAAEDSAAGASGAEVISAIAPMLSSMQKAALTQSGVQSDKRACLLRALKPYLSKERCEAIDQMIKIARISDIFRNMS